MRCENCGWNNPEGVRNCQKCNQPLASAGGDSSKSISSEPFEVNQAHDSWDKRATRFHYREDRPVGSGDVHVCKKCGYPLMDSAKVCPNCGAHISEAGDEKPLQSGLKATVRDFTSQDCRPRNAVLKATVRDAGQICEEMGPKFTLAPVDGFAPEVKPIIVGDSGSAVNDALFSIGDDGGLYLEDNSKLRNVYIQTTRRINLQVGDIVVIDNMRYIIK